MSTNPVAVIPGGRQITAKEALAATLKHDTGCPVCSKPLLAIKEGDRAYFRHRPREKHEVEKLVTSVRS